MIRTKPLLAALVLVLVSPTGVLLADSRASDPGVRSGPAGAGDPLPGLQALFATVKATFQEVDDLGSGLGPRFNLDGCAGCHSQPAIGGSSPAVNPQVAVATAFGARNVVPFFVTANGPVREA